MERRTPSLRRTLIVATLVSAVLAFGVCAALVVVSARLHGTTSSTAAAVRSVHHADEIQSELRRHGRTTDPLDRARVERAVGVQLAVTAPYATTDRGRRALARAERAVDAYFAAAEGAVSPETARDLRDAAIEALGELVAANLAKTDVAVARAEEVDRVATALGIGIVVVLLPVTAALLWWLKTRAFRPVLALAATMGRYGHGDHGARAVAEGPAELRMMAERFNEMARALDSHRGAMLASVGGIAHDLRNPLSALAMACQVLDPDRPLPPEPQLRRTLALVTRQIQRLERMIADLLDTTRIEAGRLELRLQVADARELVRGVAELFAATSPDHHVRVLVPDAGIPVRCDPVRVEQVITNLVSNAIKYSPAGGEIDLEAAVVGGRAMVRVTDHGIGLDPQERDRIFEPFHRARRAGDLAPGVGLGLSVVKRIVDAHRGAIEVESEPGRGSTFRVYVPLVEPGAAMA